MWIDVPIAAVAIAAYACWIYVLRYKGMLGEDDLYRVAVGIMNGAKTGLYLGSTLHYGKAFSFGYVAGIYRFASPGTLHDAQALMALMNAIGFWSAIAGCAGLWLVTKTLYGTRSASITVCLFAFSPMLLELGTSGHQILPGFALLMASALCLLARAEGGKARLTLRLAGFVLLVAALAVRAEVLLALPFVAVARADAGSLRVYLRSTSRGGIVPVAAYAVFLTLKHTLVDATPGCEQLVPFLKQYFLPQNVRMGLVACVFNCGVASLVLGMAAVAWVAWKYRRSKADGEAAKLAWQRALPPLVLLACTFTFWITDPLPGRHFILFLTGLSLLAGYMLDSVLGARPLRVYAALACVVVANQAMGAAAEARLLRIHSEWVTLPGYDRIPLWGIPAGTSLKYHRVTVREFESLAEFSAQLRASSEPNVVVVSARMPEILLFLNDGKTTWQGHWLGPFPGVEARSGNRSILVLSTLEARPEDAVPRVLSDPGLSGYKAIRDPVSETVYDRMAIPPERELQLGTLARR